MYDLVFTQILFGWEGPEPLHFLVWLFHACCHCLISHWFPKCSATHVAGRTFYPFSSHVLLFHFVGQVWMFWPESFPKQVVPRCPKVHEVMSWDFDTATRYWHWCEPFHTGTQINIKTHVSWANDMFENLFATSCLGVVLLLWLIDAILSIFVTYIYIYTYLCISNIFPFLYLHTMSYVKYHLFIYIIYLYIIYLYIIYHISFVIYHLHIYIYIHIHTYTYIYIHIHSIWELAFPIPVLHDGFHTCNHWNFEHSATMLGVAKDELGKLRVKDPLRVP